MKLDFNGAVRNTLKEQEAIRELLGRKSNFTQTRLMRGMENPRFCWETTIAVM